MSRIYQSLKHRRSDRSKDSDRSSKHGERGSSSRNGKAVGAAATSLFRSDPEENVRLWMEKYFPNASITREEAIRQWLGRPAEFRVQSILESPASGEAPRATDIEVPVSGGIAEVEDAGGMAEESEDLRGHWESASQPILTGAVEVPSDRSKKINGLVFRLVVCSVLAFVIIKLLWAIPETHLFSHADSSAPASASHAVEQTAPAIAAVPNGEGEAARRARNDPGPSRIEKLSIGCDHAQPCLEINTQGKETVPTLTTLTNPDRLVIDFQDVAYSADVHRINVGRGALKAVRISGGGDEKAPRARVVLDLTTSCEYDLQTAANKFVVNLSPKGNPRRQE